MNSAASELAELKRAGGDSAEARPEDYGLDHPVATAKLTWTEADEPSAVKTPDDRVRHRHPGHRHHRRARGGAVDGALRALVRARRREEAGRRLPEPGRLRRPLRRRQPHRNRPRAAGRLVLSRRDGAWWLSEPLADLADAGEADRLAGQLTGLRVVEFLPGRAGPRRPLAPAAPLSRQPDGGEGRRDVGRLRRDALGRQLGLRAAGRPGPHGGPARSWTSSPRRPSRSVARASSRSTGAT